jgi:hypothetical protein
MNVKMVGTVILLAFVAASVGYLVVSESNSAGAGDVASGPETSQTTPGGELAGAKAELPAPRENGAAPSDPAATPAQPARKVIAYYFHSTQRCMTCNKIERLAAEALREHFPDALAEGELEWRSVNLEEPPNAHFVRDYQLVASSLVLVDVHDGQQRDWTNMEKVWQYVHVEETQFKQYVAEQTRKYLES